MKLFRSLAGILLCFGLMGQPLLKAQTIYDNDPMQRLPIGMQLSEYQQHLPTVARWIKPEFVPLIGG